RKPFISICCFCLCAKLSTAAELVSKAADNSARGPMQFELVNEDLRTQGHFIGHSEHYVSELWGNRIDIWRNRTRPLSISLVKARSGASPMLTGCSLGVTNYI